MLDLTPYLLQGFQILPKITAIINGVSTPVVFNDSTHTDQLVFGGMEPENQAILTIETTLIPNARSLKGKKVIIDSNTWRIINIRYGKTVTHITIIAENHT